MRRVKGLAFIMQFWMILRVCGSVYYVKETGNDQADASSWATAAASVQSALDRASPGDQVWIASGIYHPSDVRQASSGENLLLSSFQLRDGVSIFGGFAGNEQSQQERLLQDKDGNGLQEAWEFAAETVLSGREGSPGSVLYGGLEPFSEPVLIDGVSICHGQASGAGRDGEGGGAFLPGNCTLQRSRLYENIARRGGGAAVVGAGVIRQCFFQNNELYMEGWAGEGAGVLLEGGGACLENSLVLSNGLESQGAYLGGGGVAVSGAGKVNFCTIVGNYGIGAGSGVRYSGSDGQLSNSVIWGNQGNPSQLSSNETQLQNNAVEASQEIPGCLVLSAANCGESGSAVNDNRVHSYYPCFEAPERGDFRLAAGSYLLNRAQAALEQVDSASRLRNRTRYSDIGCYEEDFPGNLTGDFQISVPLVYAESSLLVFCAGQATPYLTEVNFSSGSALADWRKESASLWSLTSRQAGVIELVLNLVPLPEISSCWNPFILQRALPVQPKSLLLKADDLTCQWGNETPLLTWQIVSGRLADGDEIVGSLQTAQPDQPGEYPIEQGTLRVSDAAGGANNQLEVLPGVLTCVKGNTQIQFSSMEKTYSGSAAGVVIETVPLGLTVNVTYEGVDGTAYPLSSEPPVNAGKYRVAAQVEDTYYTGVDSSLLLIRQAPLLCRAEDQIRDYLQANPSLTIRYEGFLAGDSAADITEPTAFTSAGRLSPVIESGYEIYLQGGSALNYQLEFQSGILMIRKAQGLFNEVLLSVGVYGMPLKQILIMGYAISPLDGSYLPGVFVWDQENQVLAAGLWQCFWHFIPDDSLNYQSLSGTSQVIIEKREVRVVALPGNKTYGDSDPVLKYHVAAGSLAAGDAFTGTLQRLPGENVGDFSVVQGSLALNENYDLHFTGDFFHILPRNIPVQAADSSKYEGQPDPELSWFCTGEVPTDADWISGSLQRMAGEAPGQYPVLQGDLRVSDNYLLEFHPGTLTILPPVYRLVGELLITNPVYGQPLCGELIEGVVENAATGELVSGHFCWEEENSFPLSGMLLAGWYFIPDLDEGFPQLTGILEIEVEKALLQVTCKGLPSRKYAEDNPPFELLFDGFVLGEDSSVLLQAPEAICLADASSLPGEYVIRIEGGLADNYDFVCPSAVLQVLPLVIQVQASNQQKAYSQADPELTFTFTGTLLGQDAFSGQLERESGELPGNYSILQGTLALPSYYQLNFSAGNLLIGLIPITLKADDCQIFYGQSPQELTWQVVSGTLLDEKDLDGTLTSDWKMRPGTYEISQGSLYADSKYQLTFIPGVLEVLPRPLTIKALDNKKDYSREEPNQGFEWKIVSGNLIMQDEITGALEREPGEEPGEYRITRGTIEVSPAENYQFTFIEGVFRIEKIVPTGYAFPLTVIYHGDILSKVEYVSHFINRYSNLELPGITYFPEGDLRMRKGATSRNLVFSPEDKVHYADTSTSMLVQVRVRFLKVTAEDKSMIYGDALPELSWNIGDYELFPDEEISGELTLVDAVSGVAADKTVPLPVGEYRILQGTLQPPSENYLFQYTPGRLTVNKRVVVVHALDSSKAAGTEDPLLEYEISSGSLADGDEISGQLSRVAGENHGTYPIRQGTLALNSNYELAFTEGVFTIFAAPGTRSGGTVSSSPSLPVPQASSAQALPDIELFSGALVEEEEFEEAADFSLHVDMPGEDVAMLVQVQAVSCEKTFGSSDPQLQYRVIGGGDAGLVLQGHPVRQPGEDAGTYSIQQGNLHCPGGARLQFIPGTFQILPRTITVAALDQQKYQGESDPPFTWELKETGLGDVQVSGQLDRGEGEQPGFYEIRQGTLQVSGRNHLLAYDPGRLTILPPAYVARGVQAENLVYGQALQYSKLTGEVIFTEGQQQQRGEFVWQQADLIPESGTRIAAWNFIFADTEVLPLQGECRLTVLPRSLKVSGVCQEKLQGQPDPELLFQYAKEYQVDEYLEISGKLTRSPGEWAGSYASSLGTLNFGPNYQVDFSPGRLLIQANSIVVDEAWKNSKKNGDMIEFAGETYRFGADALTDLSEALERVSSGGNILVLPGEYASSSGDWVLEKKLRLQGLRKDERFPVLKDALQIKGAAASGIIIEGFAFVQEKQTLGSSALIITSGASSIQVRDNVFLGGNPSIQAAGICDLTLRNNIIESPSACLMFGQREGGHSSCRGVLLLQNVLRPAAAADPEYRHILLYDDNINSSGILAAWDNCFTELQISGREQPDILAKVKLQIADKDQKGWPGKGEVRLHKQK